MKKHSTPESFMDEFKKLCKLQSRTEADAIFHAAKVHDYWEYLSDIPMKYLVAVARAWPTKSPFMLSTSDWREGALKIRQEERESSTALTMDEERRIFEEREAQFQADYEKYLKLPLAERKTIEDMATKQAEIKDSITGEFRELLERMRRKAIRGNVVELYRRQYQRKGA